MKWACIWGAACIKERGRLDRGQGWWPWCRSRRPRSAVCRYSSRRAVISHQASNRRAGSRGWERRAHSIPRPPFSASNSKGSCERHDLDPARSCLRERIRCRGDGGPARVNVVDQDDRSRRVAGGSERAGDVAATLREGEPALPLPTMTPHKELEQRKAPRRREVGRECPGRVVASPQAAVAGRRNERRGLDLRRRNVLEDELGSDLGEPAPSTLLPCPDDTGDRSLVRDGRPCGCKGKTPARALAASRDRPGDLVSAALAERGPERNTSRTT